MQWNCNHLEQPKSGDTTPTVAQDGGSHAVDCQAPQGSKPNIFVVEVEGFQVYGDFYVKELAFYNPTTHKCWSTLFKPPFEKKHLKKKGLQCIEYSTTNIHGLKWEDGIYPYSALYTVVSHFASSSILYAKGLQKCKWLQQYTCSSIYDLDQLGCPPAKDLPHQCLCMYHNSVLKDCALDKSLRLGKYVADMFQMMPGPPMASTESVMTTPCDLTNVN